MQGKELLKERDCMSFEGFCSCVKMDIQKELGMQFSVRLENVIKNNDRRLTGLVIMQHGDNMSPSIYLEPFYEMYENGKEISCIEKDIIQFYGEHKKGIQFDSAFFLSWEKIQKKVIYKLINYDRNKAFLEDVPHRKILDLAIVYECILTVDDEGIASVLIHNCHMQQWAVTEEDLFTTASQNTPHLMGNMLTNMEGFIKQMITSGKIEEDSMGSLQNGIIPMYILTNRYKFHGAAVILYQNLLMRIADEWGCDICIIPSSIHETILTPMDMVYGDCDYLSQMIRNVNQTHVAKEEILSDHAYQFRRKNHDSQICIMGRCDG